MNEAQDDIGFATDPVPEAAQACRAIFARRPEETGRVLGRLLNQGRRVRRGELAFGVAIDSTSKFLESLSRAAARRRIDGLLARPPMRTGSAAFPLGNDVRFREVTFAYPDAPGRDVLRAIDVTARAGTVTAIVGPSGSGKTTFTRLAARFWDVDRGSIEIGGVDVRALPVETLMRGITCVFQDVALLNDTVAANLRLGHPDASDDELVRAARAAGAHDFIAALPLRYNTVIGDRGTLLSRGERQRLQIARAFLKDAPIVILDEPTASMDPATEAGIADALVPLLRGRTGIAVAHRLSTIVDADRIVVLDRSGSVEAQGSHAELLASSSTYAAMWAAYAGPTDRAQRRERVAP